MGVAGQNRIERANCGGTAGVNLAGIMAGRRMDPEALLGIRRGYPFPPGKGPGEGAMPPYQKKK